MSSYKAYLAVIALVLLRLASTPTANLSYALLAGLALLGRPHAILALALSWLFTVLSPGLAAEATQGSVGRYAVILGAAASVFLRSGIISGGLRISPYIAVICGLGGLLVLHSIFFSPIPDISILKAVSWTVVFATLVAAWQGLSDTGRDRLANQMFWGLVAIMVVSLPLVLLPVGYLRNGLGFQGIMNHPQSFGSTMALLSAWAASAVFTEQRPGWRVVLILGVAFGMVILSQSRTAGFAMALGVSIALFSAPLLAGKSLLTIMPGLASQRVWSLFGVALFVLVAFAPKVGTIIESYVTKSGRAGDVQSILEAYQDSRGRLLDQMWQNIAEHPLSGIGFGIASKAYEMDIQRDPVFGLPVGAAIEKGVLPVAVLEEVGIFGAGIVGLLTWLLVLRGARGGFVPLAMTATILLLNIGESTFFSPGGMGLLTLILIAWATTAPTKRGIRI